MSYEQDRIDMLEDELRAATERAEKAEALTLESAKELLQMRERAEQAEQQLDRWKVCNTCGGSPHPSGAICIWVFHTEQERDTLS